MRLPASEKLEIIRLVEQSHLPARRTLQMLGIKPSTFYRWYDRFRSGGPEALEDKAPRPMGTAGPRRGGKTRTRPCAPRSGAAASRRPNAGPDPSKSASRRSVIRSPTGRCTRG